MKRLFLALSIIILFFCSKEVDGQNKKFGLGVMIGEPTGISAKAWLSGQNALAIGVAWYTGGNRFYKDFDYSNRTHFHADYLWHSFYAISSNGSFPLFYGIGGAINSGPRFEGTLGARGVLGIAWLPKGTPLDIFLEIVPTLYLINSTGFGIDAGLGARVFF